MTSVKRRAAGLIAVTLLAASMLGWLAAGAQEIMVPPVDIARVDPIRLAEADIAAGRFRVLCVSQGWGCQVPAIGTRNYERCYSGSTTVETLAWFGDVIGGDYDVRARRESVEFASKYNITLVGLLDKLGKRWCPAAEDWDALARSVGIALRDLAVVPGFPYLDVSRDAATGHYFRLVTDYPAWVNTAVRSAICHNAARHGVRHRVWVAVGAPPLDRPSLPKARFPPPTDRFQCEEGKLVE